MSMCIYIHTEKRKSETTLYSLQAYTCLVFSVITTYIKYIPNEVLSIFPYQYFSKSAGLPWIPIEHVHLNLTSVDRDHFEKSAEKSAAFNNFRPCNGLGNEVILSGLLNPRKDACNGDGIRIIKLFINLLKARVVTKPSSCAVAFIPYIYLAHRPNPHSFLTHNCSQFSVCTALPAHQPHLPGCYNSFLGLLYNSDSWEAATPNTRIQTKIQIANVKCHLQGWFHPIIFLFKKCKFCHYLYIA